jgi:hypothetical protein
MAITFHESVGEKIYNALINHIYEGGRYSDSGVLFKRIDGSYASVYFEGHHMYDVDESKSFALQLQ